MMMPVIRLVLLSILAACAPLPRPMPSADAIHVTSRAIPLSTVNPAQWRVGRLRFLGGLQLQSADPRFGGLSGLRWHNGRLYAVSDAGDWFVIGVRETGDQLTGVGPVRSARLTEPDGTPTGGKTRGDAEALNLNFGACATESCDPASVSIAFERDHRIWTYALKDSMPVGPPRTMALPADWLKQLPDNGGMEAVAGIDGLWLIVPESLRSASGAARALVFHNGLSSDAAASQRQEVEVPVAEAFSPTDADYLDGREFLLLFRRYSPLRGLAARIEQVKVTSGPDGRPHVETRFVAALQPPLNVDNMEGLAVRHEGDRVFVYLVSDDNFSGLQRTLLMKFELLPK